MDLLKPVSDRQYPFWPPGGVPVGQIALGRSVSQLVEDLGVNQIFSGRQTEIPVIQRTLPRQGRAEGPTSEQWEERGHYGTDLYQQFMAPYTQRQK